MIGEYGFPVEDSSSVRLQASEAGVRRFKEARFGMSVHWGLYSLSTHGREWIYYDDKIPYEIYKKRMAKFNPTRFNAEEWADLMIEAGQKALLITSKHHDGFCLWDAAETDFKISNTTFKRDVLAELAPALRERDIDLHFYYSLIDWTHPAYKNDWAAYIEYYQNQLRELCTNFGKLGGILFDGYWPRFDFSDEWAEAMSPRGEWDLAGTYDLIHGLQPDAMIVNNTHILAQPGEDYQIWELDIPGENTVGFNGVEIGDNPTACWWNANQWSYQPWNHCMKTSHELLTTFRKLREMDSMFFLNVAPRPFGDIHPEEQRVLREMGQKIREYGL